MTDACYALSVYNTTDVTAMGPDTLVWTQQSLCASDYGALGGIRFTGLCDANAGGFDEAGEPNDPDFNNTVKLVVNDLFWGGDWDGEGAALSPDTDYINPCPQTPDGEDNGCILTIPCTKNQDAKVLFNLTVMRDARLGFFDTVVKFKDVYCAAKLDCVEDDGETTLTYLHDPNATPPGDGPTAVLGFACTGGDGGDAFMYLDDLVITCRDADDNITRTATVDPSGGPGNLAAPDLANTGFTVTDDVLFGAAVNTGDAFEGTTYWNVLLGLNLPGAPGETCVLETRGTVGEVAFTNNATPENTRYPYIDWSVTLTEDGQRTCTRHPLNGGESGVHTTYTDIDAPRTFAHSLAPTTSNCPCWDFAAVRAAMDTIIARDLETLEYDWSIDVDFDGNSDTTVEVMLGVADQQTAALVGAGRYGDTFLCARYEGPDDADHTWLESIAPTTISAAQFEHCLDETLTLLDNPCFTNNGGCVDLCRYDGPGAHTCIGCESDADCADGDVCDAEGVCVTPTPSGPTLTALVIFPQDFTLQMGPGQTSSIPFIAVGHLSDGSTVNPWPGVAWTSSDSNIVAMSGNTAYTVSPGEVTITGSVSGFSDTTTLTVAWID
jgi:hypothetical protein